MRLSGPTLEVRRSLGLLTIVCLCLIVERIVGGSARIASRPRSSLALLETEKLNINCAAACSFEKLPGAGPALAKRIVEAREQGPFAQVDDLLRVSGIGPVTLARWRPVLRAGAMCRREGSSGAPN